MLLIIANKILIKIKPVNYFIIYILMFMHKFQFKSNFVFT